MALASSSLRKKGKAGHIAAAIARAVGAGRAVAVETVDFGDPNRPKTCVEVDFPEVHLAVVPREIPQGFAAFCSPAGQPSASLAPDEFEQRGWCQQEKNLQGRLKVVSPLEIAQAWHGKHRQSMTSDYGQAMFLIGGCFDGSGINVADTLKNEHFKPHPALGALLDWHARHPSAQDVRNAAARALAIYRDWERSHQDKVKQMSLFFGEAAS
jgi:hypothetical protein